ncbi:hypothetical protein PybrP1_003904 [[Pythium] brassicae (nom. inval.)]|nr:hypothetical protein PybrP1_003904 [[Pythium] brassicae (nom. inval.)]
MAATGAVFASVAKVLETGVGLSFLQHQHAAFSACPALSMNVDDARLSVSSVPPGAPGTPAHSAAAAAASEQDMQDWTSVVLDYSLRHEHVALDISTDRVLYHLECELEQPIPTTYLAHCEYLCLGWPLGGIWKIKKVGESNRFLTCVAWRKTELTPEAVAEIALKYATPVEPAEPAAGAASPASAGPQEALAPTPRRTAIRPPPVILFEWKMQFGTWDNASHVFVCEVGSPPSLQSADAVAEPADTLLSATLLVGFAAVEVSLEVNSLTAVDTVNQSFTADVTWELSFPGLTTLREDSALRELLDMLEFKEDDLEFSNVSEVQSEKPLVSILEPAGRVKFVDPLAPQTAATLATTTAQRLYHLKYSRRLLASFNEEMSLYSFPFDQQKLTFAFNMSKSVRPSIMVAPPSADPPGRFALENFKLGNVFDVVFGDKLFVGKVTDIGASKAIRFEMMLERQSGYYLTNVVLPAAVITYLCFITYAPQLGEDGASFGAMLDTGSRLQVVVTLVLTNVTFKYNLASLLPQVSYFTAIDKYVLVCFIITCVVTLENALFPLFASYLPGPVTDYKENDLLWITFYGFTLLNVGWGLYILSWVKMRSYRSRTLLIVNEYVRIIAKAIPNRHKEQVLRAYLAKMNFKSWSIPALMTTKRGDLFVQLPSDSPAEGKDRSPHEPTSGIYRKQALRELPSIQKFYSEMEAANAHAGRARSPVGSGPGWTRSANSPVAATASAPAAPVEGVAAVVAMEYDSSSAASVVVNMDVQENPPSTPYSAYKGN